MIALTSIDFGNFITHPLMKPPGLEERTEKEKIQFLKEGVMVDTATGIVTFYGTYVSEKWSFELRRGAEEQRAIIDVRPVNATAADLGSASEKLTILISDFFNKMVFELDGTFLTFQDMMVTAKGAEPSLMLSLDITVKKFPSPGLEF